MESDDLFLALGISDAQQFIKPKKNISTAERLELLQIAVGDGLCDLLGIFGKGWKSSSVIVELEGGTIRLGNVELVRDRRSMDQRRFEAALASKKQYQSWRRSIIRLCRVHGIRWRSAVVVSAARCENGPVATSTDRIFPDKGGPSTAQKAAGRLGEAP